MASRARASTVSAWTPTPTGALRAASLVAQRARRRAVTHTLAVGVRVREGGRDLADIGEEVEEGVGGDEARRRHRHHLPHTHSPRHAPPRPSLPLPVRCATQGSSVPQEVELEAVRAGLSLARGRQSIWRVEGVRGSSGAPTRARGERARLFTLAVRLFDSVCTLGLCAPAGR